MRAAIAFLLTALVVAPGALAAVPTVTARVEPARPLFGDAFDYVVEARLPEGTPGTDQARVTAGTLPFTTLAAPVTTRSSASDGTVEIALVQRLACLELACAPGDGARVVRLPPALLDVAGGLSRSAATEVAVAPRVPGAAVRASRPVYRRSTMPPPPTTTVDPGLAQALFLGAGVVLVAGGVLMLGLVVLRRGPAGRRRAAQDALDRALRLLRESALRPPPDRRRAASLVSRLVDRGAGRDRGALAGDARRLAWSRQEPPPEEATALAARVESTAAGVREG